MGALRDHIEIEIEVIECLLKLGISTIIGTYSRTALGQGYVYLPRPSLALSQRGYSH